MTDARELTLALGGRWHGRYGTCACPCCQPERRKGQNALTLGYGNGRRLVLDCKKTACAFLDILAAAGLRAGDHRAPDPATLAQRDRYAKAEAQRKATQAKRLWDEAQPIAGTVAEAYLRNVRGISCPLPPDAALSWRLLAWADCAALSGDGGAGARRGLACCASHLPSPRWLGQGRH